jgi:hypothetical protein
VAARPPPNGLQVRIRPEFSLFRLLHNKPQHLESPEFNSHTDEYGRSRGQGSCVEVVGRR